MSSYYHLSVSIIGRGKGRSAVACAAYRSGTTMADMRYGKTHDYQPRRGIMETGIEAPHSAPGWVRDREALWNAVEQFERRKDAQLSREFVVAFPHQLDASQRQEILQEFINEQITSRSLVADWAIHAPNRAGSDFNWHAHIMTTMRSVTDDGFVATKDRSLNKPDQLVQWREAWAEIQNRSFERFGICAEDGHILRVDHRSYEAQDIDREPTLHMGVHATSMERRGFETEVGSLNRSILTLNEARDMVRRQAKDLTRAAVEFIISVNDNQSGRHQSESRSADRDYEP